MEEGGQGRDGGARMEGGRANVFELFLSLGQPLQPVFLCLPFQHQVHFALYLLAAWGNFWERDAHLYLSFLQRP